MEESRLPTIECWKCGHSFHGYTSTYCPNCGMNWYHERKQIPLRLGFPFWRLVGIGIVLLGIPACNWIVKVVEAWSH